MTTEPPAATVLADRARRGLAGTRWRLEWLATTGSTNADLLAVAAAGEPAGAVLAAEHQEAGRGRLDRRWEDDPGSSLLVSILLRPDLTPDRAHLAGVAVALAAVRACEEVADVRPSLKWPNDLVMGEGPSTRKLGGVLAESVVAGGRLEAIVVGIGINAALPAVLPPELAGVATSLAAHAPGPDVDRAALLAALLRSLDALVDLLDSAAGRERLLDEYRRRCVTLGATVRVELSDDHVLAGTVTGVDPDGHLLVDDADGLTHTVVVGDVVHLRPAD